MRIIMESLTIFMIHFIKILEYDTKPNDSDAFDYLCAVASQKIDPPSLKPKSLHLDTPVVFYSPLRRSAECLKMERPSRYIPSSLLKEIPFDMKQMCPKEEWLTGKSALVRKRFKDRFIKDQLLMKKEDIFEEVRKILAQCCSAAGTSEVSVVSHSFRMKIIQAFLGTKGRIEEEASLIHGYIHDDRKTFEFGKGFSIAENDLSFL